MGKDKWYTIAVMSILKNEKYTGNALLGKTVKTDVLSKKRIKNDCTQSPLYYAEGTHPAIISKEIFDMAQSEIEKRRMEKSTAVGNTRFASKYPFSGLLICAKCGSRMSRHVITQESGTRVVSWACANKLSNGRNCCDSRNVREYVLQNTYLAAIKEITDNADEVVDTVKRGVDLECSDNENDQLLEVNDKIIALQEAVLALHKSKQKMEIGATDYEAKVKEYSEQMNELESEQERLSHTENHYNEIKATLDAIEKSIKDAWMMSEDDTAIMRSMVEQIIVRENEIEINFKCGVTIRHKFVK